MPIPTLFVLKIKCYYELMKDIYVLDIIHYKDIFSLNYLNE